MKFQIDFNQIGDKNNTTEFFEKLGCSHILGDEFDYWEKDIASLDSLEIFIRKVRELTEDDSYNLLLDFNNYFHTIYLDKVKL